MILTRLKPSALALLLLTCLTAVAQEEYTMKRQRLSDNINTPYTETKPIISYDNRILYLTRQYHPENTGGKVDVQDIFYALRGEGWEWEKPVNIGAPLNNTEPNGISSLSVGGDTILVINSYSTTGVNEGAAISIRNSSSGEWSAPVPVLIENYKNKSDFVDYFISSTGDHMFLAIENKESLGDQDIYVSFRTETGWSTPVNLGSAVNTPDGEFSPFLSSDNKTLFFSSYGHEGYGQCDVFYSQRLDDTWTNWSPAKNLGENINSPGFEAYFTIPAKGEYAYFVSDVESRDNSRDIFRAVIPLEFNPTPGVILSGVTYNELKMEAISANVLATPVDKSGERKLFVTRKENGFKYMRSIMEYPRQFQLLAEQEQYMSTSQYLTVMHRDKRELVANLYLVPIAVGNTLVSHDVAFAPGTANLTDRGRMELGRMVGYLRKYPTIKFDITCHVAKSASAEADQKLSEDRLAVIQQFFQKEGIAENRLWWDAAGSTVPFENKNNILILDASAPNDRVEFTIFADKDGDTVPDLRDKCPEEPGIVKNLGCPEIKEEVQQVFAQALNGIQFETAKAIIKPESFPILDNVMKVMSENPGFFLKISGHTDSDGEENDNQVLSDNRAAATLKYLQDKGIAAERMKAYGFGESRPIADNATVKGRALNRRVEFEVVFDQDAL